MNQQMSQKKSNRSWLVNAWDAITQPSSMLVEVGARRQAQLVSALSLLLAVLSVLGTIGSIAANQGIGTSFYLQLPLAVASTLGYFISRTRYYRGASWLIVVALSFLGFASSLSGENPPVEAILFYEPFAFLIAVGTLTWLEVVAFTGINLLAVLVLALVNPVYTPAVAGTIAGQFLTVGVLSTAVLAARNAVERDRLAEVNRFNQQLQSLTTGLEQRVAERTRDIALAAEVGRRISAVRDLSRLLEDAVELIRERFGLYYTQIYLIDPTHHSLVLRAGTGETGKTMLRQRHRLPLEVTSINGTAAVERRPVVVADTAGSLVFRPNPLLPDTRSEMSVPLISGDRVLGVLDLQSSRPGALTEESLPAFETLAGQLATALVNAELFQRVEHSLAEVETRTRQSAQAGWSEYLDGIHERERIAYTVDLDGVKPLVEPVDLAGGGYTLDAPISISGQPVGRLQFSTDKPWSAEAADLAQSVAAQVAQQVENLRLISQAERFRQETEEAMRRLTHEEWEGYLTNTLSGDLAYQFSEGQVHPLQSSLNGHNGDLQISIRIQDETIGKIGVRGQEYLNQEDRALVETVSEQLAAHLENMRLYATAQQELTERQRAQESLAHRAAQLATVAQISTTVSNIQSPDEMLQTVVDLTRQAFELYHAHIYLLDENSEQLVLTRGAGSIGRQMVSEGRQIAVNAEKSLVARAARTRQGVIVNDVRTDPDFLPHPLLQETRSEMAVPMIAGERLLGVLDVQDEEVGRFTADDVNIMTTLSAQVAISLQNARSYARAQRQAEREALINTISERIQATNSVESALQVAVREIGRALGAQHAAVRLGLERKQDAG